MQCIQFTSNLHRLCVVASFLLSGIKNGTSSESEVSRNLNSKRCNPLLSAGCCRHNSLVPSLLLSGYTCTSFLFGTGTSTSNLAFHTVRWFGTSYYNFLRRFTFISLIYFYFLTLLHFIQVCTPLMSCLSSSQSCQFDLTTKQ